MIAVLAAVLALAGAPATSQIVCDPTLVSLYGGVTSEGLAAPTDGRAWVGISGCRAIFASSLTPREYAAVEKANDLVLGWDQGEGLLVLLHEARHLAGEDNECRAELFARENVAVLIDRFVPPAERPYAREAAAMLDGRTRQSAVYRDGC